MRSFYNKEDSKNNIHRSISAFFASYDYLQIFALILLLTTGVIFIRAIGLQHDNTSFFYKQLVWIGLSFVVWFACSWIDYRSVEFKFLGIMFYLFSIFMLMIVLVFGVEVYSAKRWIDIPIVGMRLQPSEFSKIGLIFLLSSLFSGNYFKVNSLISLLIGVLAVGVPFGLIVIEPDLGSALILLPIFVLIVFCAGLKWRYISVALIVVAILGTGAVLNETYRIRPLLKEYQRARIKTFLDPEHDLQGTGYNQYQSRLAVGSGGMFGKGIGEGTQHRLGFLPSTITRNDFIFSVIAEDVGFFGCLLVFGMYGLLFFSILRTIFICNDNYGRYMGVGICGVIFSHTMINIGMNLGLTPVTGLSLPFISYGGSFIFTGMLLLGLMQSIYRHRK